MLMGVCKYPCATDRSETVQSIRHDLGSWNEQPRNTIDQDSFAEPVDFMHPNIQRMPLWREAAAATNGFLPSVVL